MRGEAPHSSICQAQGVTRAALCSAQEVLEPMENREHHSSRKKARMEFPGGQVKQEETEEPEAAAGGGAPVAAEGAVTMEEEDLTVTLRKATLHCPVCNLPFKPQIFQCEAGHLVCSTCRGGDPMNRCHSCGRAVSWARNTPLEDVVRTARIQCPYHVYGCQSTVAYHAAGDHARECPFAPCRCAEPGCDFAGSPPTLLGHLEDSHSWPVQNIRYGKACHLQLSEPSGEPRRLLAAEDGAVFLAAVAAVGAHGARHGAAVVCVRANAPAAGQQYTCKMVAIGNPGAITGWTETVTAEADVPSSSVPGGDATAAEAAAPLSVPRAMLHGQFEEMHLRICIDKS